MSAQWILHFLAFVSVTGIYAHDIGNVTVQESIPAVNAAQTKTTEQPIMDNKSKDIAKQPMTIEDPDPIDEYINRIIGWAWRKLSPYWYQRRSVRWGTYGLAGFMVLKFFIISPSDLIGLLLTQYQNKGIGHMAGKQAAEGVRAEIVKEETLEAIDTASYRAGRSAVKGALDEASERISQIPSNIRKATKEWLIQLIPTTIAYK